MEKYLGAEEMKLKVLKFHEKECTFFTSATGLCCTVVLQRYLEVRTVQNIHSDVVALQTRSLLSYVPAAEGYTLWPLLQPGSASSDGPGQTSVQSRSQGHPV